jgi:hypothetical protein
MADTKIQQNKNNKSTSVRSRAGRPKMAPELKRKSVTHVVSPKTQRSLSAIQKITKLRTHGAVVDMLAQTWIDLNTKPSKKQQ